ncbi:hypothetical protein BJX65DRAFT_312986 [Aspergillus insuetus]
MFQLITTSANQGLYSQNSGGWGRIYPARGSHRTVSELIVRRLFGRDDVKEEEHEQESEESPSSATPSQLPENPKPAPAALARSWQESPPPQLFAENVDEFRALPSKCLRADAYEQLVEEEPELIKALEADLLKTQSQNPQSAQEAESTTEQRLQSLVQQRLVDVEASRAGFTVGGKRVLVREQAGKIIHAIVSVKHFIPAAVSAEPHAYVTRQHPTTKG